ncbi:MAG: hotdog fold thioesterase [Rhizobiales bacterium]|nr:hotdog fold thioesterase [Hyphomicrobiales bacterium]
MRGYGGDGAGDIFEPRDPDFELRVRRSFAAQAFMGHLGAELTLVAPGAADIAMAFRPELTQQHGHFHAGTTTAIADSAAGYAALSLFPAGTGVLTADFTMNLLRPAGGVRLVAEGRVIKSGRTMTVCRGDVFSEAADGARRHVATGLFTMMQLAGIND